MEVVYLLLFVRSGYVAGNRKYCSGSRCGSVTEERKPLAKLAKDAAAGAVLLAAIMAVIAGLILFVPEGLEFLCMVLK